MYIFISCKRIQIKHGNEAGSGMKGTDLLGNFSSFRAFQRLNGHFFLIYAQI